MIIAILSIPASLAIKKPFHDPDRHAYYTGPSLETLRDNLFPRFTANAAGSSTPKGQRDSFQTVFGVVFPAVNGILAGKISPYVATSGLSHDFIGASMSGDLRKPGKSIAKGTFWALEATFVIYVSVLVMMASSVERPTFYKDLGVLQDVSFCSSSIFR
jgi:potassium/chloride transporter 9